MNEENEKLSDETSNVQSIDNSTSIEYIKPVEVKKVTPLPIKKITLLGFILAANNTSIWMIFAFLPFMVNFFYPDLTLNEIGFKAGLLGSAFSTGSLLGTAISSLCFGFSTTYWFAILSRFMWGFLNGNIGVSKTYMAEILDDSNSAKGMALYGVIGGIDMDDSCRSPSLSPIIKRNSLYSQIHVHDPDSPDEEVKEYTVHDDIRTDQIDSQLDSKLDSHSDRHAHNLKKRKGKSKVTFTGFVMVKCIDSNDITYGKLNQIKDNDSPIDTVPADRFVISPITANNISTSLPTNPLIKDDDISKDDFNITIKPEDKYLPDVIPLYSNGSENIMSKPKKTFLQYIFYLLSQKQILISTLLYGVNAFNQLASTEIIPLWVVTSVHDGGFNYNSHLIGVATMITGQTFASLGRLSGPYVGANLFAWSETNSLSWPLNYYFTFYLFGVFGILFTKLGSLLPKSIQRRKREPKVPRYTDIDDASNYEGDSEDGEDSKIVK
eukprot:gene17406-22955_t